MTATLSPQERIFYERLAERPGHPVPIVDLLNASDSDGFNAVAKVVVHRIRRKLGVEIVSHRNGRGPRSKSGAYSLKEKTDGE